MCKILHCRCNFYGIHTLIDLSTNEENDKYLMKLGIGVFKSDHLVPSPLANPTNLLSVQITIVKTFPSDLMEVIDTIAIKVG